MIQVFSLQYVVNETTNKDRTIVLVTRM